jgi:hypothetical protein
MAGPTAAANNTRFNQERREMSEIGKIPRALESD